MPDIYEAEWSGAHPLFTMFDMQRINMDDNQPKKPSSGDDLPPDGHNELTLTVDSIFVGKEFRTESYSQPWVIKHAPWYVNDLSFLCNTLKWPLFIIISLSRLQPLVELWFVLHSFDQIGGK